MQSIEEEKSNFSSLEKQITQQEGQLKNIIKS